MIQGNTIIFVVQKSGGAFQSPLLKTFSTTSRDSFYDYEDPLSERYDDVVSNFCILRNKEFWNNFDIHINCQYMDINIFIRVTTSRTTKI